MKKEEIRLFYIKRRKSNDNLLPPGANNPTRKANKERKFFQMGAIFGSVAK